MIISLLELRLLLLYVTALCLFVFELHNTKKVSLKISSIMDLDRLKNLRPIVYEKWALVPSFFGVSIISLCALIVFTTLPSVSVSDYCLGSYLSSWPRYVDLYFAVLVMFIPSFIFLLQEKQEMIVSLLKAGLLFSVFWAAIQLFFIPDAFFTPILTDLAVRFLFGFFLALSIYRLINIENTLLWLVIAGVIVASIALLMFKIVSLFIYIIPVYSSLAMAYLVAYVMVWLLGIAYLAWLCIGGPYYFLPDVMLIVGLFARMLSGRFFKNSISDVFVKWILLEFKSGKTSVEISEHKSLPSFEKVLLRINDDFFFYLETMILKVFAENGFVVELTDEAGNKMKYSPKWRASRKWYPILKKNPRITRITVHFNKELYNTWKEALSNAKKRLTKNERRDVVGYKELLKVTNLTPFQIKTVFIISRET
ncbi:MAG: hypothetical protein J7L47_05335 [Candidatus Odinarchaeota archaeon]|nr:hypothetical protein [Candidatus Odinarchaeota archaeon]